jgi:predicted metal-dependent HD superfamily phosphohydrolase
MELKQNQQHTELRTASLPKLSVAPEGKEHHELLLRTAVAVGRFSELPVVVEGLIRLYTELPARLTFHNPQHTVDVLHDSLLLGLADGLPEEHLELLAIAATYHDIGYLERDVANEPIGAAAAREAMSRHGYREEQITAVQSMIMSTQLQLSPGGNYLMQKPQSELAKYLCDADLATLGKENFFVRSLAFYEELSGKKTKDPSELQNEKGRSAVAATIKIMSFHHYHTPAGQQVYEGTKNSNLEQLKRFFITMFGVNSERLQEGWMQLLPSSERRPQELPASKESPIGPRMLEKFFVTNTEAVDGALMVNFSDGTSARTWWKPLTGYGRSGEILDGEDPKLTEAQRAALRVHFPGDSGI